jgi:exodeoxyribonuclease-3
MLAARGRGQAEFAVDMARQRGATLFVIYVRTLRVLDMRPGAVPRIENDPQAQVALMGDWNIAPRDEDVWSMEFYLDKSHVSPRERAAFDAIVDAGYADVVRPHAPGPGVYTYWDYQQLRFPKKQGMRIDFVLGSPAFAARVEGAAIDREERKGQGASDHAPVVVQLAD